MPHAVGHGPAGRGRRCGGHRHDDGRAGGAKRLIEGVLQREVPESETGTLNNVMHWLYGTSWGVAYGIVEGSRSRRPSLRSGLVFGSVVWAASLVESPALGVAPPVWEYPPRELVSDVALHLAYGAGAAAAFAPLRR